VGCLSRIGCAVVLVAGAAGGYWLYGDRLPSVLSRAATGAADKVTDAAVRTSERLDSQEGARIAAEEEARRRAAREARDKELGWVTVNADNPVIPKGNPLAPLRRRSGPAYVSLTASQVAGFLAPLLKQLPPSAATAQLALDGDQLLVRTSVSLSDFTGQTAIGAVLGKALVGEDTLFLAGPLEPVRPGLAQFQIRELRLKGIDVPTRVIPGIVRGLRAAAGQSAQGERATRPAVDSADSAGRGADGVALDALPVPLPSTVSDVRVVNGKLTLYRATSSPKKKP
jgi:hypothetical protein